jgi:hypothetical protein
MYSAIINHQVQIQLTKSAHNYEIYYPNLYEGQGVVIDNITILYTGQTGEHEIKVFQTENCPQHEDDPPLVIHECKMLYWRAKMYAKITKEIKVMEQEDKEGEHILLRDVHVWLNDVNFYSETIGQLVDYYWRNEMYNSVLMILRKEGELEGEYSPMDHDDNLD